MSVSNSAAWAPPGRCRDQFQNTQAVLRLDSRLELLLNSLDMIWLAPYLRDEEWSRCSPRRASSGFQSKLFVALLDWGQAHLGKPSTRLIDYNYKLAYLYMRTPDVSDR